MSVSNGANADETTFNAAFVSKTQADTKAGALTLSDTTEATTKDTGALIVDGGVGVEKNIHVGGDAVITGDLTVNGTTTTINTTTTEIADPNIVINDNIKIIFAFFFIISFSCYLIINCMHIAFFFAFLTYSFTSSVCSISCIAFITF